MPDDQAETNGRSTALRDPGTTAVLHGMLATLSEALERLDGRLGRLEEGVGVVTSTAAEVERELAWQRERLEEVCTQLPQLRQTPAAGEQARDLMARVGRGQLELASRLDALAEQVATARPADLTIERHLAELAAGVQELEERLVALATAGALPERVDALAAQVCTVADNLDALRDREAAGATSGEVLRRTESLTRSVDTLARNVVGFAGDVQQQLEALAADVHAPRPVDSVLEERLEVLAERVATMCERSEGWRRSELALAERVEVLGVRLEELAGRVEAPRAGEVVVAERLEVLGARLEELAGRVEAQGLPRAELERRLGEVLDEIRALGAVAAAVSTRGATSAELAGAVEHVVGEIGRQVGAVPPALGDQLARVLDPVAGRWDDLARSVDAAALTVARLREEVDALRSDAADQREAASDLEAVAATVVGALSDLRSALGNRPEELVELVTDVREQVGQLAGRPDAARAVARYTAAVAERLDNHVASLLEAVDAAADRAAAAGAVELRSVGEATAQLEQAVQAWVEDASRRQEAVAEGVAAIAGRACEQHEVLQTLVERLATVEARTVEAVQGLSGSNEALAVLTARESEMRAVLEQLARTADEARRVGAEVRDSLRELGAADGGQADADLLARHRAAWQADLDRLQTTLRGALADVSGRASSVAAVVGALDGRVHGLLESVRAVGSAAHAAAQVRPLIEALRAEVEELRVLQLEHVAPVPRS